MSDDGGSSGELVRARGVMPPGDIRQCATALSNNTELVRYFNTRGEDGHPPGNTWLADKEEKLGNIGEATELFCDLLQTTGRVVPVTVGSHTLKMSDNGIVITGEQEIGHRRFTETDPTLWLEPETGLYGAAEVALRSTDLVVIAPGNLYGSLLPALAVSGMRETLQRIKTQKVMVANLLTKPGQTDDWHVVQYVKTMEQYIGYGCIDTALYNTDLPSAKMLEEYSSPGEQPVKIEAQRFREIAARSIGALLLSRTTASVSENDHLMKHKRTQIKHDARAVARQLMSLAATSY